MPLESFLRMVTRLFGGDHDWVRPLDTRERQDDRRQAGVELPAIRRHPRIDFKHQRDTHEQDEIREEFAEHRRTLEAVARAHE